MYSSRRKVDFLYEKREYKKLLKLFCNKRILRKYIRKCGIIDYSINYNFVRRRTQIKINKEFKGHNYNTDILTFNLGDSDVKLTGDVYISLNKVKKNSERYGKELGEEINRVIIHGFLHLIGFNDNTPKEKKIMRKKEDKYLSFYMKKFHVEQ